MEAMMRGGKGRIKRAEKCVTYSLPELLLVPGRAKVSLDFESQV